MQFKKILSYLGFPQVVYRTSSPINGEIKVISTFGKYSISVGNLTQSGPIVEGLWKEAIKSIKYQVLSIKKILVLGVGGGSVIKVLHQYFPQAKVTGIEIDPKMIEVGRKYFNLDKYQANIIHSDAFTFVEHLKQEKYDLIIVDILLGRKTPERLTQKSFLNKLKVLLNKNGIIIFNRLRLKESKDDTNFINNLKNIFTNVNIHKPLVNTLIFCKISGNKPSFEV